MPLFDFSCNNEQCQHLVEDEWITWQEASDKEFAFKCPKCGTACKKLPALTGRHLSWSTWRMMQGD